MLVLYFAWLRERIGTAEEEVSPPAEVASVSELMRWLAGQSPGHAAAFADPRLIRCAVEHELASPGAKLAEAHEVAFFPPLTGG